MKKYLKIKRYIDAKFLKRDIDSKVEEFIVIYDFTMFLYFLSIVKYFPLLKILVHRKAR